MEGGWRRFDRAPMAVYRRYPNQLAQNIERRAVGKPIAIHGRVEAHNGTSLHGRRKEPSHTGEMLAECRYDITMPDDPQTSGRLDSSEGWI